MKVDKSKPSHWFRLLRFGSMVLLAWLLRRSGRRQQRPKVVLYGHKLSGNLLEIHRAMVASSDLEPTFLTMDPDYHAQLAGAGVRSCLAGSIASATLLAEAKAVISDHGLHVLAWMVGRSSLKFFDVWHGIPFKGFDADDFRVQHGYDEVWVASPLHKQLYETRFGFDPDRVRITGYARTDPLVLPRAGRMEELERFGLAALPSTRLVLFAPTWKQDSSNRSLFPFGLEESDFLEKLAGECRAHGATLLVRKHLNSGRHATAPPDDVVYVPFAEYPDTEALLALSDLLICDWSSIAFDYLLLGRPTIFLDVEPPFRKGFSLGPEYRFGRVVGDMQAMLDAVRRYLAEPASYRAEVGDRPRQVLAEVYGDRPDGMASQRCLERLRLHLSR
ncbi:CDP-glycerol glycerophosphotransferase family protein [Arenimonas donghaensis]|uniref:CDP-glycerol glycerophosphotransferase family protein n=1 Tax=Arenimonas donghaensis TaxID=375061 RepID=UPI000556E269|nr:CDP-glycerol glycerophosphotransferase family protein [Arenimonas donghaensis]